MPLYGVNSFGSLRGSLRIATPAPTNNTYSTSNIVLQSGNTYAFTVRRTPNIANAETVNVSVNPSASNPATPAEIAMISYLTKATFAAGSATATVSITSPAAQPE